MSNLHRLEDKVFVSCPSLWGERKIGGPVYAGLTYSQSFIVMINARNRANFANWCKKYARTGTAVRCAYLCIQCEVNKMAVLMGNLEVIKREIKQENGLQPQSEPKANV